MPLLEAEQGGEGGEVAPRSDSGRYARNGRSDRRSGRAGEPLKRRRRDRADTCPVPAGRPVLEHAAHNDLGLVRYYEYLDEGEPPRPATLRSNSSVCSWCLGAKQTPLAKLHATARRLDDRCGNSGGTQAGGCRWAPRRSFSLSALSRVTCSRPFCTGPRVHGGGFVEVQSLWGRWGARSE